MKSTELNAPSDEYLAISVALRKMVNDMAEERRERILSWDLAPCDPEFR